MTNDNSQLTNFEKLFELYYSDLVNFTAYLLKENSVAESLVLNLFIKVWQLYQESFTRFENTRYYLFRATYLECQHAIKKPGNPNTHITGNHASSRSLVYYFSDPYTLNLATNQLPSNLGQIMKLFYLEGLSLPEIASKLNLPLPELKAYKQKAEDHLAVAAHAH